MWEFCGVCAVCGNYVWFVQTNSAVNPMPYRHNAVWASAITEKIQHTCWNIMAGRWIAVSICWRITNVRQKKPALSVEKNRIVSIKNKMLAFCSILRIADYIKEKNCFLFHTGKSKKPTSTKFDRQKCQKTHKSLAFSTAWMEKASRTPSAMCRSMSAL